ncbi:MAG TPA: DMT family transporter [Stellaceae bacterium]|nr:DMT family transporter [Stellaceae bacterium]
MTDALSLSHSLPGETPAARYRRGALLVATASVAWSGAGLIVRMVATDAWTTLFWRSVFACLSLLIYVALRDRRGVVGAFRGIGWIGLLLAGCFASSMICFILALGQTTVANVMIFQAASPFVAAIFAWLLLGERVRPSGIAAIAATLCGIAIMVSNAVETGQLAGDLLSAVMGLGFAGTIVLARHRRDLPMTPATCLATAITALVALPLADHPFAVAPTDLALLGLFGIGQMGLGLILFMAGVRLIPAADAGLISILESVLGPFWVWVALGENPDIRALIGGAIVLIAVILHTLAEKRAADLRNAVHPI